MNTFDSVERRLPPRTPRAVFASIAGLASGLLAAFVATGWLRASLPESGLVWNVVPPARVAVWFLAIAHGVPLRLQATAGLRGSDVSLGRLGELVAGAGPPEITFGFSLLLVPIGLLAVVGTITALAVRRLDPPTAARLAVTTASVAVVHGVSLGLLARLARVSLGFGGTLAPELGLGAATGSVGLVIGPSVAQTFLLGAVWGAAFAVAGGLSTPRMRALLADATRIQLRGWLRGLGTGAGITLAVFVVGTVVVIVSGRVPSPPAAALGAAMLAANASAAGLVLAHGASMRVALDAGPFTGWERVDLLHFGVAGGPAPFPAWIAVLIPLASGVVAARFVRSRTSMSAPAIASRFAVLWGLTLAVLALLLRVRVLSSFSVGGLQLGGGSAAIDPVAAMLLGAVWGWLAALLGAVTARNRMSPD